MTMWIKMPYLKGSRVTKKRKMMRACQCVESCISWRSLAILLLFLITSYMLKRNTWYCLKRQGENALTSKHEYLQRDQQKISGPAFIQSWWNMRKGFLDSFQGLLADGANSTDPRLIRLIRNHIFPPAKGAYKMSYNFEPTAQYAITNDHFKKKGKARRFFIECGGLDGERSSTTYHLEKDGWEGLLIEADSDYFFQSLGKNRRSWKLNAALCPSSEPTVVKFREMGNSGRGKVTRKGTNYVPCVPLSTILKALNRTKIDFLSLDVEGLEMKILRSLPFKDMNIEAINLEYNHNEEKPASFTKFMASMGYMLLEKIDAKNPKQHLFTHDLYYVKAKG